MLNPWNFISKEMLRIILKNVEEFAFVKFRYEFLKTTWEIPEGL